MSRERGVGESGLADLVSDATPFSLALNGSFRGVTHRSGLLIEGPFGWGEFAPFDDYDDPHAALWLTAALEAAYVGFPEPVRDRVGVNAILGVHSIAASVAQVRVAVRERGCRTIKVKVADPGESAHQEFDRVAAIRAALDAERPDGSGRLRLDANGGWTAPEACGRLERLAELGVEYVEQPCRSVKDMTTVKRAGILPVAADEAIRIDGEVENVAVFADVAVLKTMPLGGVRAALRIAESVGVPVVVSGSMDSSVGLASGLYLAGCLPAEPLDCGLGTGALLAQDLTVRTVLPEAGEIGVERPTPDSRRLIEATDRVGADQRDYWISRLERAWVHVPDEVKGLVAA